MRATLGKAASMDRCGIALIIALLIQFLASPVFALNFQDELDAGIYFRTSNRQKSITHLNKAIALNPDSAEAYFNRGLTLIELKKFGAAKNDFTKAITHNYQLPKAYSRRAYCLLMEKDYQRGIKDCTEAIRLNKNDITSYRNRAEAYAHTGQKGLAQDDRLGVKALEKDPPPDELLEQASKLAKQKRTADAIVLCNKIIEKEPLNDKAYNLRGQMREEEAFGRSTKELADKSAIDKECAAALEDYSKAMAINPRNLRALFDKASLLTEMGQYKNALPYWDQFIKKVPDDEFAYDSRARSHAYCQQLDAAVRDMTVALKLLPDSGEMLITRARLLHKLGRFNEALADINKVMPMAPDDSDVLTIRGKLHYNIAKYAQALQDFNAALKLEPDSGTLYFLRSRVQAKLGNYKEASADLERSKKYGVNKSKTEDLLKKINDFQFKRKTTW